MKDRQPITIKDSFINNQNKFEVARKLRTNEDDGRLALQMGWAIPFGGYPEGFLAHEVQMRLHFTPNSLQEISSRATDPLAQKALKRKVEILVAGKQLEQAHMSLFKTSFARDLTDDQIENYMREMEGDDKFGWVAGALAGRTIRFDTLIPTKRAVILVAEDVVPVALKARFTLKKLVERHNKDGNMQLIDSTDLTHITAARFAEKSVPKRLIKFAGDIRNIAQEIRRNPLEVTVERATLTTSLAAVRHEAPHLIKKDSSTK